MYVIESPFGYVISDAQNPPSRWVALEGLEQLVVRSGEQEPSACSTS